MAAVIVMETTSVIVHDLEEFTARMRQMGATHCTYITLDGKPALEAPIAVPDAQALELLKAPARTLVP